MNPTKISKSATPAVAANPPMAANENVFAERNLSDIQKSSEDEIFYRKQDAPAFSRLFACSCRSDLLYVAEISVIFP